MKNCARKWFSYLCIILIEVTLAKASPGLVVVLSKNPLWWNWDLVTIPFMYTACASQNQSLTQSVINQVLALHSQHISRRVADPCSKALASPATGLKNFRGLEEALMTVGGFGLRGITNRLTCYLPGRKSGLGWLTQGKIATILWRSKLP